MEHTSDIFVQFLGIILILLILLIFAVKFFINTYLPFIEERDYIHMEIASNSGTEKRYWQAELRNLYIGCIPFLGKLINGKLHPRKRK